MARSPDQGGRDHLIRVGIDTVKGYTTSLSGLELVKPTVVQLEDLGSFDHVMLLDVRNKTEFSEGHMRAPNS